MSIRRATWLLEQRACSFVPERDLERAITVRTKRPDFVVETGRGVRFLMEVESLEAPSALDRVDPRVRTFSLDPMALQKRMNHTVRNGADQLAPYQNDRMPLVVALDNHRQIGLSIGRVERIQVFG